MAVADAGVGLEDAAGQGDDGFQLGLFHELLPRLDEGIGGAEEDALRDDDACGAAAVEQSEDALGEEEFGLGGIQREGFVEVAFINAASEGRVGHDDARSRPAPAEAFAEGVLVIDMGILNAVHHGGS